MAQEYIAIRNQDNGILALSTNVFSSIAMIAIDEEKNVALAEKGPFKNNISCKLMDDKLILTINIVVKYNVNVQETCADLQHKIYDNIKHMCEIEPDVVDIKVVGFDFKE